MAANEAFDYDAQCRRIKRIKRIYDVRDHAKSGPRFGQFLDSILKVPEDLRDTLIDSLEADTGLNLEE